jgi:Flp pilus assembly protein TadD
VVARIVSSFDLQGGSAYTRFLIWQAAFESIAERPLLGWGPDTFVLLFPRLKTPEYVAAAGYNNFADNVHSYPLQLASGVGVTGALALYGTIGWALVASARSAFARDGAANRLVLAALWAGVVGYVVHLTFGISVIGSTGTMWAMLAALMAPVARERRVEAPSWGRVAAVGAGVAAAAVVVWAASIGAADYTHARGYVATDPRDAAQAYERAVRLNPLNDRYRAQVGSAWRAAAEASLEQAGAAQGAGADPSQFVQAASEAFAASERWTKATIAFAPDASQNYSFLASLYILGSTAFDPALSGKAIEITEERLKVEPNGAENRYLLGVALAANRRFDEAQEQARLAAELDPNWPDPTILLGDLAREAGRLEEARDAYARALALPKAAAIDPGRVQRVRDALASVEASLAAVSQ